MSWPSGGPRGTAPLVVGLMSIALIVACSSADDGTGRADGSDVPTAPLGDVAETGDSLPRPAPPPAGDPTGAEPGRDDRAAPSAQAGVGSASPEGASLQSVASRYVTGLGMAALDDVLTRYGVACDPPEGEPGDMAWSCFGADAAHDVEYSVSIDGADEDRIRHVTALVTQYGAPDLELAAGFLGDLASVDYRGARPSRTRDWVRAWLNGAAASDDVTVGDAALALQGTLESCSLDLVAPEIAAP